MVAEIGLVLDCADPQRLTEFWSKALAYTTLGGAGSYVLLVDQSGGRPKLLLQQVAETKTAKNRMHLDIETPDVDGEVDRLCGLGATRIVRPLAEHGSRWVVMHDPEGNGFCVCDGGHPA
jgi:predicted enzyme related to lactoylglutathione lyase